MPGDRREERVRPRPSSSPTVAYVSPAGATAMLPDYGSAGPTATDDLPVGARVHHFEIIREIGRGGMGRVYLARDTRLARKVALKFLLSESSELTQRFLIEARNTARCQHENIVVIYEVGEWSGRPYMALEYLEGAPLGELMDRGRLPFARIIEIVVGVVRALVRAHAHGIVHCDLKPSNILVTHDGAVKVLDFGIARLLGASSTSDEHTSGTPAFMAPEQWGVDAIDHRADLWAIGIMLWFLIADQHPLGEVTTARLVAAAANLDEPMPRLATAAAVPTALDELVARCLCKRKADRYGSAADLLAALEALAPARARVPLDAPPFQGMAAFEEGDAARFFGRERDVARAVGRITERPLLLIAGPSGVGKSSFVRAGLVPALKAVGAWRVLVLRPGRAPLDALAAACAEVIADPGERAGLSRRLLAEPGALGTLLRGHATRTGQRVLVFVDQFEEIFTLADDREARAAFVAALAGAADDQSSPVRLVISTRSDFLDHIADQPALLERVGEGLVFLRPLGAAGLREALERPLLATDYQFEPGIVDDMIAQLGDVAGALPLVQFAASSLWDARDVASKRLTRAAYDAMGGIAGALASHAEDVVRELAPRQRNLLRGLLSRLVTPNGTRAVVDRAELESLDSEVGALIDRLVAARLLAVSGQAGEATLEIVHESLIRAWPTLRRWREEDGDDAAVVAQVRTAAFQWDQRGRPVGMLWTGDAVAEARTFLARYTGELAERERAFLDAALALADRAGRRRRRFVVGSFVALVGLFAAALVAVVWIRDAEHTARTQRDAAEHEAANARRAKAEAQRQLAATLEAHRARDAERSDRERAEHEAAEAAAQRDLTAASLGDARDAVAKTQEDLEAANQRLRRALADATRAREKAETASARAGALATELQRALAAEKRRADEAERKAAGLAKGKNLE